MNWEVMGALVEIIGGLGVIVSLLYVARQIRDNTHSNQSAAINALTGQLMNLTLIKPGFPDEFVAYVDSAAHLTPAVDYMAGSLS